MIKDYVYPIPDDGYPEADLTTRIVVCVVASIVVAVLFYVSIIIW